MTVTIGAMCGASSALQSASIVLCADRLERVSKIGSASN